MKMINKQRVQRIKNLIYAFIIILMFLPLILMSILSFQMFGAIKDLNTKVDNLGKAAAVQSTGQSPAESSAPDSGYVLEPDGQVSRSANEEESEGNLNADSSPEVGEDLATAPEDVSFDVGVRGESTQPPPADGGNELGGGAPIEDGEYLGAASTDASNEGTSGAAGAADADAAGTAGTAGANANSQSTEAEKELATNPQMGYGDGAPSPDHTLNPSTGS